MPDAETELLTVAIGQDRDAGPCSCGQFQIHDER